MRISEIMNLNESRIDPSSIVTDDLKEIVKVFKSNGFDIKIAGGAVRDLLLGKDPKDIDLATTATPDEMVELLKDFRTIPTGLQHGTITVLGRRTGEEYEITTLRIDTNQTGRHADVEWTTDFKQDAARRDLTYNAMFMDLDGTLHDYFGGKEDLEKGITKAVGDTGERFQEDYLRILRLFRFSARYGHKLEPEVINAITRNAKGLKQVSGERYWLEMQKILSTPKAELAADQMIKTGVADIIGLNVTNFDGLKLAEKGDPILTLAAIVDTKTAKNLVEKWKLSSEEGNRLVTVAALNPYTWTEKQMKEQIVNHKKSEWAKARFVDALVIQGRSSSIKSWDIPVFPVTGQDLINIGVKPGPDMGKVLKALKDRWIASNFTASKEELLKTA